MILLDRFDIERLIVVDDDDDGAGNGDCPLIAGNARKTGVDETSRECFSI